MLSFWPGFRGLTRYGYWSFLGIAVLFAILLDLFIIANCYWTSAISPAQRNIFLLVLAFAWVLLYSAANLRLKQMDTAFALDEGDETYRLALVHYLRGNWYETESLIIPHLKRKPRDIEMLLLQATLYRHTNRLEDATEVLDRLELFSGANRWFLEIEHERQAIQEARQEESEPDPEDQQLADGSQDILPCKSLA